MAWMESSGGGGWERGGDVCTSQWEFGGEVPRAFWGFQCVHVCSNMEEIDGEIDTVQYILPQPKTRSTKSIAYICVHDVSMLHSTALSSSLSCLSHPEHNLLSYQIISPPLTSPPSVSTPFYTQPTNLPTGSYTRPREYLLHTTIGSGELGIPSALPYTSFKLPPVS